MLNDNELFKLSFPNKELDGIDELYFRKSVGVELADNNKELIFEIGGTASFDTYFNLFSYAKYLRYTNVSKFALELMLCGEFLISLMVKRSKTSMDLKRERNDKKIYEKEDECVCKRIFSSDKAEKCTLEVDFSDELELYEGFFYFQLTSLKSGSILYGGRYFTSDCVTNDVNVAIVICTYKREKYVEKNIDLIFSDLIKNENSSVQDNLDIIVVDNGQTLDKKNFPQTNLCIVKNSNYGGAGGFTRGIIEAYYNKEKYSHILLLDDDVVVSTEAIEKTINVLKHRKEEYKDLYVAAGMIPLDNPSFQFEDTAKWNGREFINQKQLDLKNIFSLLFNEYEEHADYGSWYYQCLPMQIVNENNLPLPIFIKFDDMEYSIRNMKQCLVMNGICIWHENFGKKISPCLEYYYTRNQMILNSVHSLSGGIKYDIKRICKTTIFNCFLQRYSVAEMTLKGLFDYMQGIDFLKNSREDCLHQELIKKCDKYISVDELKRQGVLFNKCNYERTFSRNNKKNRILTKITLGGHLIPNCFLKNDLVIIDSNIGSPSMVMGYQNTLQWNPSDEKGYVTSIQKKRFWRIMFLLIKLIIKYARVRKKLEAEYRERVYEITNLTFWEKHLSIGA